MFQAPRQLARVRDSAQAGSSFGVETGEGIVMISEIELAAQLRSQLNALEDIPRLNGYIVIRGETGCL